MHHPESYDISVKLQDTLASLPANGRSQTNHLICALGHHILCASMPLSTIVPWTQERGVNTPA